LQIAECRIDCRFQSAEWIADFRVQNGISECRMVRTVTHSAICILHSAISPFSYQTGDSVFHVGDLGLEFRVGFAPEVHKFVVGLHRFVHLIPRFV